MSRELNNTLNERIAAELGYKIVEMDEPEPLDTPIPWVDIKYTHHVIDPEGRVVSHSMHHSKMERIYGLPGWDDNLTEALALCVGLTVEIEVEPDVPSALITVTVKSYQFKGIALGRSSSNMGSAIARTVCEAWLRYREEVHDA